MTPSRQSVPRHLLFIYYLMDSDGVCNRPALCILLECLFTEVGAAFAAPPTFDPPKPALLEKGLEFFGFAAWLVLEEGLSAVDSFLELYMCRIGALNAAKL